MYSPRYSPQHSDQGEASSSHSSSTTGSGPRSPSRTRSSRTARPTPVGDVGSNLPMETIQSLNAVYNAGPIYIGEGMGSPLQGRSSSPVSSGSGKSNHSLSPTHSHSTSSLGSGASSSGREGLTLPVSPLVTDHPHESSAMASSQLPHSEDLRQARDTVLLDVHSQFRELHRENALLKQELDGREAKLSSSMNSIKTFWSPELKKERALRKEEASRIQALKEQCRVAVDDNQQFSKTVKQLQSELQQQKEFNAQLQMSLSTHAASAPHLHEVETLRIDREQQTKEMFLLRKTLEEMELRIETQKQTLTARDESIKKLLEMLQSKGLSTKALEGDREEMDRLRNKLIEAESRVLHMETALATREREVHQMSDRSAGLQTTTRLEKQIGAALRSENSPRAGALKALLDVKETKIIVLENQIQELEEEVTRARAKGAVNADERDEQYRELEDYRSHSKLLKNKIDQQKAEINKKGTELQTLQTKLDTFLHQQKDQQAHIDLLKESLAAKEQHSSILQADVEALRTRLEEKENTISRKEQLLSTMNTDKSKRSTEAIELREMLDIKDRKINVLQRKIDNLEENISDKTTQLDTLREKVTDLKANQSSSDSAVSSLEDALSDKDRTIECLKGQREREDKERREEIELLEKQVKDLKSKSETLQKELQEKETSFLDLKEHASSLASQSLKKDSKMTTLELNLAQKMEEVTQMEVELKRIKEEKETTEKQQIKELTLQAEKAQEEVKKSQNELDRLLEIMKQTEGEKNDKDKRISELEKSMKEATKRHTTLKRDQQHQRKMNAQLMEEARRREGELTTDTNSLQRMVKERNDRIEELGEALKESVSITADREMVLAQQTQAISNVQKQINTLKRELEETKKQLSMSTHKLSTNQTLLRDKEAKLTALQTERRKHLEEAMEMRQEAVTAAIGEKDAHIALLELNRKNPKASEELKVLKKEKDDLVRQLKDETQKRMKLIHNNTDDKPQAGQGLQDGTAVTQQQQPPANSTTITTSPVTPGEEEEEGIWA